MKDWTALTGLSYDDVVGNSGSMFVSCCALVHPLVMLNLLSADVHHQSPRVGPHVHVGILVDVKVGSISRPGETEEAASVITVQLIFPDNMLCYGNLLKRTATSQCVL